MKKYFIFASLIAIIGLFSSCDETERYSEKIPDTNLTILLETRVYNDKVTGQEYMDYWTLLDDQGNIVCPKFQRNWDNPFWNAKGIVFIPGKGTCDCRNGKIEVIPIPHIDAPKVKTYVSGGKTEYRENVDSVWVTCGIEASKTDPNIVLIHRKQGGLNGLLGRHYYEYNLQTKTLSALKEF